MVDTAPPSPQAPQHSYDKIAYRQRWEIEAFFPKLKQWRRIATRYDKRAATFLGFVEIASVSSGRRSVPRNCFASVPTLTCAKLRV